jgi:hypothetical protein
MLFGALIRGRYRDGILGRGLGELVFYDELCAASMEDNRIEGHPEYFSADVRHNRCGFRALVNLRHRHIRVAAHRDE